jgi:hypothetical protein
MNAISLLGSMLPWQVQQPGATAAKATLPAGNGATASGQPVATVPTNSKADAPQVQDSGAIGGLQELTAALQGLRGVADTLRAQLESMLGDTSSASSVATSVSVSIRQRASFQFVTQEGDVVDLTVRARASIESSAASVQDATGNASASHTTMIASARLSVQVHGNLNDKELAAIKDVLGQVETLADQFFGGDVQAAFAASASLHLDSTQLASMSLDLSSRLSVRGAAQSTTAATTDPAATAAAATPATSPSAAAPPAPQTVVLPAVTAPATATAAPPASVQPAVDYLANVLQQFQNVASIELSMKAKLQMLLIAVMPAAKAPDATAGSAAAKGAAGASVATAPGVAALGQLSNVTTLAA